MAKKAVSKETRPVSGVRVLIRQLTALDKQFRKFDALLTAELRRNPGLAATLSEELDKTREAVRIPAYGRFLPSHARKARKQSAMSSG
jgi:hypothetical protein